MHEPDADHDDAALAQLLRSAGRRDDPPADFGRELRATLHGEWQALVAERRRARTRWRLAGTLAATFAVAAVGLGIWFAGQPGEAVARIVQATGGGQAGTELRAGDHIATSQGERMALTFASGLELRVDVNTELVVDAGDHVTLSRGAIYVDAGAAADADRPLVVTTPYGAIRHLGTQYEARVLEGALQLSVREGRVELRHADAALQGRAGERLRVLAGGTVERLPLSADAPDWNWAGAVSPGFTIDNRPLSDFLAWAGRETGREVVFASAAVEAEAGRIILRGAVTGLTPDQAIDAVLATTTLRAERSPGRLTLGD